MQWYTIETTWSKDRMKTTKKQRFKYIQEVRSTPACVLTALHCRVASSNRYRSSTFNHHVITCVYTFVFCCAHRAYGLVVALLDQTWGQAKPCSRYTNNNVDKIKLFVLGVAEGQGY